MYPFPVRQAQPADENDIVALWRACGLVVSYNNPAKDFRFALHGACSDVLVACDGDHIVGSVMVGHDGHRGWLYYVAASPDRRGTGIGKVMVSAGEDWLRHRGVAKVQLMVRESNAAMAAFYAHLGFEETPRVVMAKWLA